MDALLDQVRDVAEGQIDFAGQKLADAISTTMLASFSAWGLLLGFIQDDIHLAMWIVLAGTFITLLVVVPPWPMYNKNPQPWLGSRLRLTMPHGGGVNPGLKIS